MNELKKFWNEEDGFGTVELVILIAVLVAVAVFFSGAIRDFVTKQTEAIFGNANDGIVTSISQ